MSSAASFFEHLAKFGPQEDVAQSPPEGFLFNRHLIITLFSFLPRGKRERPRAPLLQHDSRGGGGAWDTGNVKGMVGWALWQPRPQDSPACFPPSFSSGVSEVGG